MEHADLNALIDRAGNETPVDELMMRRLKKKKLQLRDEIAILKGQKPRPKIKPSSLESATPPSQQEGSKKEKPDKRSGSEKRSKNAELTIHRRVPLHIDDLPPVPSSRAMKTTSSKS